MTQEEKAQRKRENNLRWYYNKHDQNKAKARAWRLANPDKVKAAEVERHALRRARLRDARVEKVERSVLFERDGGTCYLCEKPVDPDSSWHMDHVVPLAAGGEHSYENVRVTHPLCNQAKYVSLI